MEVAEGVKAAGTPGNRAFVELGEEIQRGFQDDSGLGADELGIGRRLGQQDPEALDIGNAADERQPVLIRPFGQLDELTLTAL